MIRLRMYSTLSAVLASSLAITVAAQGQSVAITEWMYDGSSAAGGEFVEFTNVGEIAVDMTGWSYDDSNRIPGKVDLSAFGIVQPGESVILAEDAPEDFRADWSLDAGVKVIGNLGNPVGHNLGRNDEINLYDSQGKLVDRLTYGDQDFPGTIRTRWFSGNPNTAKAVGVNDPYQWSLAAVQDQHGSWMSSNGDVGNPGMLIFDHEPPIEIPLYINEVVSSNSTGLADEDGDFEDWIEIYNAGEKSIDLDGYGLSDSYGNPFKWVFPAVTIEPGEFIVVFASSKDRNDPQSQLHTNFAIGADGEEVILTHPGGVRIDEMFPTAIPTDVSYGRKPDGTGSWVFFFEPTPGAANTTEGYDGIGSPVTFSHDAGFYTQGFELVLSTDDPLAEIHYTLNGDTPVPGGPTTHVYRGPISIDSREGDPNEHSMIPTNHHTNSFAWQPPTGEVFKITPVRAVSSRAGMLPGPVQTRSYLVDEDIDDRYSLPVIVLNTDHDNLFGHENGIYVPGASYLPGNDDTGNYFLRGDAWERPVHVEFFEEDRTLAFAQDAGVRIHGGATRRMPQKSLRLYARSSYSSDTFEHALFPDQPQYTSYRRILLRQSGNDSSHTFFRDAMLQSLAAEAGLETQAYRPAIVFLNGEYWGIHNMRERFDQHYLQRTHGIDPDEVDILEDRWIPGEGTAANYLEMMSFISNGLFGMPDTGDRDLVDDANYEHVRTLMDVDGYGAYVALQDYIRNTDWPHNNIEYWRPREPGAIWRWFTYDLDFGFGYLGGPTNDAFRRLSIANQISNGGGGYHNWATVIFRALLRNEQFRHSFLNRYADMMNTIFDPEHVIERINQMQAVIEPEMPEHIDRWNKIPSMEEWEASVQVMRNFAQVRPEWAPRRIRNHFRGTYEGLPGEMFYTDPSFNFFTVTFNNPTPQWGHIRVNTIDLAEYGYPWSGVYWRTVPLPITAVPEPGYQFNGFAGYPESAGTETWYFMLQSNTTLTAQFAPVSGAGDLTGDGVVDVSDLLVLLGAWGQCPEGSSCLGDLNDDGAVDVSDLLILLAHWS